MKEHIKKLLILLQGINLKVPEEKSSASEVLEQSLKTWLRQSKTQIVYKLQIGYPRNAITGLSVFASLLGSCFSLDKALLIERRVDQTLSGPLKEYIQTCLVNFCNFTRTVGIKR